MLNTEFRTTDNSGQGSQGEPESMPSQTGEQGGKPPVSSDPATFQPQGEGLVSQPGVTQDQKLLPETDKQVVEKFIVQITPYVQESLGHSSVKKPSELGDNISTANVLLGLAKAKTVKGQEGLLHGGTELLEPVLRESFTKEATRKLEVVFATELSRSGSRNLKNIRNLIRGVSESEGSPINMEDYNTIVNNFAGRIKLNFENAIEEAQKGKRTEILRKSRDFMLLTEEAFGAGFANKLRRSYREAFGSSIPEHPSTVKEDALGDNPKPLFILQE